MDFLDYFWEREVEFRVTCLYFFCRECLISREAGTGACTWDGTRMCLRGSEIQRCRWARRRLDLTRNLAALNPKPLDL